MRYHDSSPFRSDPVDQLINLAGEQLGASGNRAAGERLHTPKEAADIFLEAARLNLEDPLRTGSLLVFPHYGQLVMTGDLHGHRRNFGKLQRYCCLEQFAARHVILHEIIHQELESLKDTDSSHLVLLEAAKWKCAFPDQVHFLQSNHEAAQVTGHEITKQGRSVTHDFEIALRDTYGDGAGSVSQAIYAFIRSYPLAARTPNRVFLSHSLPSDSELPGFNAEVFARLPTDEDFADDRSAHALIWGRHQSEETLAALRSLLDVDYFICGHQPQEMGYEVFHERMLVLASEHNHGVFLPIDLGKPVTMEGLVGKIRPFAGVA